MKILADFSCLNADGPPVIKAWVNILNKIKYRDAGEVDIFERHGDVFIHSLSLSFAGGNTSSVKDSPRRMARLV